MYECHPGDVKRLESILRVAHAEGMTHVRVEAGAFGPNRKTENEFQLRRGGIIDVARLIGMTADLVAPNTWRKGMGFPLKAKEAKAAAIAHATEITGAKDLTDDEAEAICICLWANKQPKDNAA